MQPTSPAPLSPQPATPWPPAPPPALPVWPARPPAAEEQLSLRQLRHHSANTWQRILCDVWTLAEASGSAEARALAEAVERRIQSSMAVADTLFGLTRSPGPMRARLLRLAGAVLRGLAAPGQEIALQAEVRGDCPPVLQETVLRVAQEMLANAVRHGLHARLRGRITLRLECGAEAVRLLVGDDGWGPSPRDRPGEGGALMRDLAALRHGRVTLRREGALTLAELLLPAQG
ncbi:ATP-binding protein [Pseudoroseomonas cervicalis]|uniref:ATP-binding protein n=1 Tax=Teichococcus cervicalis TaxID=204525 RepID=UPI00278B7721|nr:ATP-binding protein [Pseudoroseomonas cervicalis]MDQ1081758.1 two-component sensor histidine kinase [Pseudoroseomonas cervicalis]